MPARFLCILLLFSCILAAQEPQLQWVNGAGGASMSVEGRQVITDATGNSYTAGAFQGTIDIDPGPATHNLVSQGPADTYIAKYGPSGNLVWAQQVRTNNGLHVLVVGIALDNTGNLYITGQFNGTVDFNPGAPVVNLSSPGTENIAFLLKLDANGNFVWVRDIARTTQGSAGHKIATSSSGNVFVMGGFRGVTDFDPGAATFNVSSTNLGRDIFISKLDNNGNFLWSKQFQGNEEQLSFAIKVDALENVYSTGIFHGTTDFDPGTAVHNLSSTAPAFDTYDTFISKLDINGNFAWVKQFVGTGNETVQGLALDQLGHLYITGDYNGIADFDPGPGVFTMTGSDAESTFIVKLSTTTGDLVWAKSFGEGDNTIQARAIVCDAAGNIYITGSFLFSIDFDPGPGSYVLTAGNYANVFIMKLRGDASFVFAKQIGVTTSYILSHGIAVDPMNSIYICGTISGFADFDPGAGIHHYTSTGDRDGYVAKYAHCTQNSTENINATACNSYTLNGQTYASSGVYTQHLINSMGCDSTIILQLTIGWESSTRMISICQGQSYFVGGADQTVTGMYKDTLTTNQGCDSIVTTELTVHSSPLPSLGEDRDLCVGATLVINPGDFALYQWQDQSTLPTLPVSNTGSYWVTVTDENNCSATDSIHIINTVQPPSGFLASSDTICQYEKLELSALTNFNSYRWSTGSVQSSIIIDQPGEYSLEVDDNNGCTGSDTILIHTKTCRIGVFIPTSFTPNGDALNDVFKAIAFGNLSSFRLEVYNRWGELVFYTNDVNRGWDGTLKGVPVPTTVFVWRCTYQLEGEKPKEEKGVLTLVR